MPLDLAFWVLSGAVVLGAGLAIRYLGSSFAPRLPGPVAIAHGLLGMAGFAALLWALRRGPPQSATGTAGFGAAATAMLGLALAFGLTIAWTSRYGRRPPGLLVAVHAGLAIAGFVLLWTLVSLG